MKEKQSFYWEEQRVHPLTGLQYQVSVQEHLLDGSKASMFTFSYLKRADQKNRGAIFAYNGGPGAPSHWLHMGLLGPKLVKFPGYPDRVQPAQFAMEDNQAFLLENCDIVLIDPPGTGWARLYDEIAASQYFSTAGDATAFAQCIVAWLKAHHRLESPIYLLGESYGTIRNLALADALPAFVNLCGIIHVGTSINVGARGTMYVEPNVRRLGANAAVCWYHHHQDERDFNEFVREALDFSYREYAHALLLGNRLPSDERQAVLDKLSYYTGLDPSFLVSHDLRFEEVDFLLRVKPGEVVSMYDARLTYHPEKGESYSANKMDGADIIEPDLTQDAFMSAVGDAFDQAIADYLSNDLKIPIERTYLSDSISIGRSWDYRSYEKDTLALPTSLMKENPDLRMMFINGYFDLSSTFDFVIWYLSQYDLDMSRVERLVLPAGHASYVGENMAETLNNAISDFIEKGAMANDIE